MAETMEVVEPGTMSLGYTPVGQGGQPTDKRFEANPQLAQQKFAEEQLAKDFAFQSQQQPASKQAPPITLSNGDKLPNPGPISDAGQLDNEYQKLVSADPRLFDPAKFPEDLVKNALKTGNLSRMIQAMKGLGEKQPKRTNVRGKPGVEKLAEKRIERAAEKIPLKRAAALTAARNAKEQIPGVAPLPAPAPPAPAPNPKLASAPAFTPQQLTEIAEGVAQKRVAAEKMEHEQTADQLEYERIKREEAKIKHEQEMKQAQEKTKTIAQETAARDYMLAEEQAKVADVTGLLENEQLQHEKTVQEMSSKLASAGMQRDLLDAQLKERDAKIAALQKERDDERARVFELAQKGELTAKDFNTALAASKEASNKIAALEQEQVALKAELGGAVQEKTQLSQKITSLEDAVRRLEGVSAAQKGEIGQHLAGIAQKEKVISELEAMVKDPTVKNSLEMQKRLLAQAEQARSSLISEKAQLATELDVTKQELKRSQFEAGLEVQRLNRSVQALDISLAEARAQLQQQMHENATAASVSVTARNQLQAMVDQQGATIQGLKVQHEAAIQQRNLAAQNYEHMKQQSEMFQREVERLKSAPIATPAAPLPPPQPPPAQLPTETPRRPPPTFGGGAGGKGAGKAIRDQEMLEAEEEEEEEEEFPQDQLDIYPSSDEEEVERELEEEEEEEEEESGRGGESGGFFRRKKRRPTPPEGRDPINASLFRRIGRV